MKLTADQLTAVLEDAGLWVLHAPEDETYLLPSRDDVLNKLAGLALRKLGQVGLTRYARNRWDCENFARHFVYWAHVAHASSTTAEAGLAVGTLIMPDHARALAVLADTDPATGRPSVVIIEPQPDRTGRIQAVTMAVPDRANTWVLI